MPDSLRGSGECRKCHRSFSKAQIGRHLRGCLDPGHGLLIKVDAPRSPYFLYLFALPDQPLELLDDTLRDVWLECCGHLSAFTVGTISYESSPEEDAFWGGPGRRQLSMDVPISRALPPGVPARYEYDFGTTTELVATVFATGISGISSDPGCVHIVARNDAPAVPCSQCGQPATIIIGWEPELYCEACGEEVSVADDEPTWPLVNSPRTGLCGYTGPSLEPMCPEREEPSIGDRRLR